VALAAIVVHLGGTVGAYLHFALVAHEVCPAHGEIIHDKADPAASSHPVHAGDAPSYEQGTGGSDDGHDVCTLTAALRERAIDRSPGHTGRCEPLPSRPQANAPEAQPAPRCAAYRIAPKTSPPHRT
jgi:hypothetical protein